MSSISAGTTSTTTLVHSGDTTGSLVFKTNDTGSGGTTAVTIDTSQNLQFNSGYGSVATAYGCRAWVNFNGQGTVSIRASGNVSSLTDYGVGDYAVNFTNAMPDENFSVSGSYNTGNSIPSRGTTSIGLNTTATGSVRVWTGYGSTTSSNGALEDPSTVCVNVFR